MRRLKARTLINASRRSYDGASRGDRFKGWRSLDSLNEVSDGALSVLRQRSRHLVQNNPYAKRAIKATFNESQRITAYSVSRDVTALGLASALEAMKSEQEQEA